MQVSVLLFPAVHTHSIPPLVGWVPASSHILGKAALRANFISY